MEFVFVLLEARGVLPAIFALPAGYGDMAIGATATFVAWKLADPSHRNSFIVWQLLGIADLIMAVSLGTTARVLDPHGASTVVMTVLPLSIVPTFLVPLFVVFHGHLYRAGKDLEASIEAHSSNSKGGAASRDLKAQERRNR